MSNSASSRPGSAEENRHEALSSELLELLDVTGPGPLADIILQRAFELNATDIHLEPTPSGLRVRYRVDGLLHEIVRLPTTAMQPIIQRIKLMANMDIAERRLAQDGHIARSMLNQPRDIRIGSGPTIYGERLVLRLMPDEAAFTRLDDLGMEPDQIETLRRVLKSPYGLILVVGPVGCGKSTSVYSFLQEISTPQKSIVTIEDPVERRNEGICQIQVEPKIDFHFADALRCVLRQDPNVMMVGEIRDAETAQIACRSALTGVLVLSTIHANNTASAIDVLQGFGVPRMFIADGLRCVLSQRLLLKVCQKHREVYHPDEAACRMLEIDPSQAQSVNLVRGLPADSNFHTGFSGRTSIFEIMEVSKPIRQAILRGDSAIEIAEIAHREGMKSLSDAARNKVLSGVTSIDQMHQSMLSFTD
ncbi:MAG: GspE/PulE family protein [Planctomyces sp.]|jgi:type II secretory ATPase GspE/PulE/Tfp pilus assembly ATPase PilB-like protein